MLHFFLVFLVAGAFSQTSYYAGKRTASTGGKKVSEMSVHAIQSLNQNSRSWAIARCVLPENTKCDNIKMALVKGIDGKWFIEMPNMEKTPMTVADDHMNLRRFYGSYKDKDGKERWSFEHLTVNGNFLWKFHSSWPNEPEMDVKTVLEPSSKEIYDNFVKGKSFK
jgi:hypothetical protein